MTERSGDNLYFAVAASASVFGLLVLGVESLNCALFSAKCYVSRDIFEFPYILFVLIGLFALGLLVNIPLLIISIVFRKSIASKKALLLLTSCFSPPIIYFIFTLISRSLSEIPSSEWKILLVLAVFGFISGVVMLKVIKKINGVTH
jgi:hypothetical protein